MCGMALPRVLVTGATGFLGPFAVRALAGQALVTTTAQNGADLALDLTLPGAVERLLRECRPDFVLHLAARSRLADCERDPAAAQRLNADVPAELAGRLSARLLFVSTDLVFDGRSAPYRAGDPIGPLSQYGLGKAQGEERVLAAGGRVARLPLLFGADPQGRGASAMVRRALAARRPLPLYTNEYRTPLHALDAARGLTALLLSPASKPLVHLPGPERMSRWQFAQRLCAAHGLPQDLLQPVECQDPSRPRDVSLTGDWLPGREFAAMLADA